MRYVLLLPIVLLLSDTLLRAQPLMLSDTFWKFQPGDNPAWSAAAFDDAAWQDIRIGRSWEEALSNSYDGLAWYRHTFEVSNRFQAEARANGGLVLLLGRIDDADETYFNGVKIGGLGAFPPGAATAWNVQRRYIVPYDLVQWDAPNTIAVRVSDTGGGGGLYGGDYGLEPLSWKDQTDLSISNADPTHTVAAGTPASVRVKLQNNWSADLPGRLVCTLRTFAGDSVAQQARGLTLARGRTHEASFSFRPVPPGFYVAELRFIGPNGYALTGSNGFAVAPEQLTSEAHRPPDFDAFWDRARAELATVPPAYHLTPDSMRSTANVEVFLVEMRSLGNVRVRGWYARPRGRTGLPAVLHVQGYGTVMDAGYVDENQDFAQFFLNVRGHGNSRDDVHPGFPGYLLAGLEKADDYIYRGAYMDCLRAVDFLAGRPEIDTSRLAVMGSSQGGALSVATAALDPRIKLCLPDVPFLSDFRRYFKVARWPGNEFAAYVAGRPGRSWEQVYRVLDYFDIMHLAPRVRVPVLMGVGLFDDVCPPEINFAMYNALGTKAKQYYLYPQSGHGLPEVQQLARWEWLRGYFRKE